MKRILATALGGLALGLCVSPASAQYPYPYPACPPCQAPYAQPPMPYPPMQMVSYAPMGGWNGNSGVMPVAAMIQPVPVYVPVDRVQYVPVFGPLETMSAEGPLARMPARAAAIPAVPQQAPVKVVAEKKPAAASPVTAVVHTANKPNVAAAPAAVQPKQESAAEKKVVQYEEAVPWTKKVHTFLFGPQW